MRIPIQSMPVKGQLNHNFNGGVNTSGLACTICKAACSSLSGLKKILCIEACKHTVC